MNAINGYFDRRLKELAMQIINSLVSSKKKGFYLGKTVSIKADGVPLEYDLHAHTPLLERPQDGTYILGRPGSGKSQLMKSCILQEIENKERAVIVIDPHGDLAEEIIQQVKSNDAKRVIYFAPATDEQKLKPLGINPFQWNNKQELEFKIDAIKNIFLNLFAINFETMSVLQNVLDTLIKILLYSYNENEYNTTFIDLFELIRDDEIGKSHREIYKNLDKDDEVLQYMLSRWEKDSNFAADVKSTMHKVMTIISDRTIKNVLAQPKSAKCFDFKKLFDEKGVFVVNLSGLEETVAQPLLGSILLLEIAAASRSRGKDERSPCHIFADEFHMFAPSTFNEIITGCRKYGLMVTLAHQVLKQLDEKAIASTQSCKNIICFDLVPEDRYKMAEHYQGLDKEIFHILRPFQAIVRLTRDNEAASSYVIKAAVSKNFPNQATSEIIQKRSLAFGTPISKVQELIKLKNQEIYKVNSKNDNMSKVPKNNTVKPQEEIVTKKYVTTGVNTNGQRPNRLAERTKKINQTEEAQEV